MTPKTACEPKVPCPIVPMVFFKHLGGPIQRTTPIIPQDDRLLEVKGDNGLFILKSIVSNTQLCDISEPFVVQRGSREKTLLPLKLQFKKGNMRTFNHEIKIRKYERSGELYTNETDNHIMFACVKDDRLVMVALGIASQNGQFYLHKMNKYDVTLYQSSDKIMIPEMPDWPTLPRYIDKMVDMSKLSILPTALPTAKGVNKSEFKLQEGVITWCDPFSGKAAAITHEGEVLVWLKSVKNNCTGLINPKAGTKIRFKSLRPPKTYEYTSFKLVAENVKTVQ